MAWDDIVSTGNSIEADTTNNIVTNIKTRAIRTTGAGVPSSTPANIGDIYIDTSDNKFYIAMGTSSSADWKKVVTQ